MLGDAFGRLVVFWFLVLIPRIRVFQLSWLERRANNAKVTGLRPVLATVFCYFFLFSYTVERGSRFQRYMRV
jgi:hypothetical protein